LLSFGAAMISTLGWNVAQNSGAASGATLRDDPPNFRGSHGFVLLSPVRPAPATPLHRLDGVVTDLAKFRGKVVLLNFWASWCVPCVAELPRLERLSAAMASEPAHIAAISVDREGVAVVAPFVRRLGLRQLVPYLDPAERIGYFKTDNPNGAPFALYRMPISYLVDKNGMIRGYVPGAALWDTKGAEALLRHYMR
jgi:thiol-disulfide isomerase/thioredoxin